MLKKAFKWLDNFWYHYKWYVIVGVFFVGIITFMVVSAHSPESKYDIQIMYCGPHIVDSNEKEEIQNALSKLLTEDYDGDGEKKVILNDIPLFTDEQYADEESEAQYYVSNPTANTMREQEQIFTQQIVSGEVSICLLDPHWYQNVKESSGFVEIEDVLGYAPVGLADECSLIFSQTELYKLCGDTFAEFPEDTLLCMRKVSTISSVFAKKRTQELYDFTYDYFKSIISLQTVGE